MWYFTWLLGVGFAVLLAIVNALWNEHEEARRASLRQPSDAPRQ
jgi:cyd operon protein YbgT